MARNHAVYPILCMIAVTLVVLSACGGVPANLPESVASPLAQATTEGPATAIAAVLTEAPAAMTSRATSGGPSTPVPPASATKVATSTAGVSAAGIPSQSASGQTPAWGVRTKTSGCVARGALPDPACTPGDIFPTATREQICVSGYSSSVRNVPESEKEQGYAEYGITHHTFGQFESDIL